MIKRESLINNLARMRFLGSRNTSRNVVPVDTYAGEKLRLLCTTVAIERFNTLGLDLLGGSLVHCLANWGCDSLTILLGA